MKRSGLLPLPWPLLLPPSAWQAPISHTPAWDPLKGVGTGCPMEAWARDRSLWARDLSSEFQGLFALSPNPHLPSGSKKPRAQGHVTLKPA